MRAKKTASQSAPGVSRRRLLQAAASGLTSLEPGAATAAAAPTAAQPRGSFYPPDRIPLDEDNDLVIVDFEPADDPRTTQLRARFDIVLA